MLYGIKNTKVAKRAENRTPHRRKKCFLQFTNIEMRKGITTNP
jgi:hypothetical protein